MKDALGRMFGEEVEKTVPGTPRVILALANHAQTAGWDRAKVLQRGCSRRQPAAAGRWSLPFTRRQRRRGAPLPDHDALDH